MVDASVCSLTGDLIMNWPPETKLGLILPGTGPETGNQTPRRVRAVEHQVAHPEQLTLLLFLE